MTIATGVTMNTARQDTASISTPPMRGPRIPPRAKLAVQTPRATARCRSTWNMDRMRESVDGASMAEPTPMRPRQTISMVGFTDKAAPIEAKPKTAAPMSSRRRRPNRSASSPMGSNRPATRKT